MITIKQIMSKMVDDLLDDSELQIFIFDDDDFVIFDDLTMERLKKFFTLYQQIFNEKTFDDKGMRLLSDPVPVRKIIEAVEFGSKKYMEIDLVDIVYDIKYKVKSICYSHWLGGMLI